MSRVEELVEQVRSLAPDEQEAFRILLDAETTDDFELSPEWKAEIQRRIEDIDSGRVKTIPWEEVGIGSESEFVPTRIETSPAASEELDVAVDHVLRIHVRRPIVSPIAMSEPSPTSWSFPSSARRVPGATIADHRLRLRSYLSSSGRWKHHHCCVSSYVQRARLLARPAVTSLAAASPTSR